LIGKVRQNGNMPIRRETFLRLLLESDALKKMEKEEEMESHTNGEFG
jgi:hypothetical protein